MALCPEFGIASQGTSIEQARTNLVEALMMLFETASPSEVARRFHNEVFVTQVEVPIGRLGVLSGSDIYRILEQHGSAEVQQRGSHRIMQKRLETTTLTVPVPLHDPVRRGTLLSIIRQAELPRSLSEAET